MTRQPATPDVWQTIIVRAIPSSYTASMMTCDRLDSGSTNRSRAGTPTASPAIPDRNSSLTATHTCCGPRNKARAPICRHHLRPVLRMRPGPAGSSALFRAMVGLGCATSTS